MPWSLDYGDQTDAVSKKPKIWIPGGCCTPEPGLVDRTDAKTKGVDLGDQSEVVPRSLISFVYNIPFVNLICNSCLIASVSHSKNLFILSYSNSERARVYDAKLSGRSILSK